MSIKNPQQDLYETIQFVREGKEEDSENPFAKKGKKGKNPFAKKGDDEDDEDDEDDDEGKENPFAKKGKKSKKGKKDEDDEEGDQVDEKYTEDQRRKREQSRRNPGDVDGKHNTGRGTEDGYSGHGGSQVGTGGLRKHGGYAAVRSTEGPKSKTNSQRRGGVTGSASMTGADNQEKKVKGEKEEPDVTGIRRSRLKQRLKDKRKTESFDDDDNAIIEEIKNRVLAVLDEGYKE